MIVHTTIDDLDLTITSRPLEINGRIVWIVDRVTASGGGDIYPILTRIRRIRKSIHRTLDVAVKDKRREWEGREEDA